MEKTLLPLTFLLPLFLQAQPTPVPDTAFTSGNRIKALANANGALFYDFQNGQFFPDESGRSPIRAAGVWMGGIDNGGNLKIAVQRYNEDGKQDFAPGLANLSEEENLHWNKIWRAKAEDILYHQTYYQLHGAIKDTIPSIFAWPGIGNKYFKQFNGFDLPKYDHLLAPFNDENYSGTYEPEKGEYPIFDRRLCGWPLPANELLWHTFHDNIVHTESGGAYPLRMTVQNQIITFDCFDNELASNAVLLNYRLINNALEDVDSFYFGMFIDFQLGCPDDDYVGSIPAENIIFAYNADDFDEDCGEYKGYGGHPPAVAVKLIRGPLNEFWQELPLSTFMVLPENPAQPGQGMPEVDDEFYNYLSGSWKDGTPLTIGGNGYDPGSTTFTKIAFPGVPGSDTSLWTEVNAGNPPGRRRVLASFGPLQFQHGSVNELMVAFVFFPNEEKNNLGALDDMNSYLHRAFDFIYADCTGGTIPGCEINIQVPEVPEPRPVIFEKVELRPNPASDVLQIWFMDEKAMYNVEVYDVLGRLIFEKKLASNVVEINVNDWERGFYTAIIQQGEERLAKPFVVMRP
jgi:hypothetical protein